MKKSIFILVLWLIAGTSFSQPSEYFSMVKDSTAENSFYEYVPEKYMELWSSSDQYLMVSIGMSKIKNKNVFYGIYVDFDSTLTKKDTLISIKTESGCRLLMECKTSREINSSSYGVYVPIDDCGFAEFISSLPIVSINLSGSTYNVSKEDNYFVNIFKEMNIRTKYFEK